jgi:hypothetical protein
MSEELAKGSGSLLAKPKVDISWHARTIEMGECVTTHDVLEQLVFVSIVFPTLEIIGSLPWYWERGWSSSSP